VPRKETIQLRGQLAEGRHGDPLVGVPQPQWRTVNGAVVVPRGGGDFEQRGSIVVKGFMIKLPPSVAIEDTDAVMVRGEEHQIDGPVNDYGKALIFYTIRVN